MSRTTFQILPADVSDAPEIVRIDNLAFENNAIMSLAFPDRTTPEFISHRIKEYEGIFSQPTTWAKKIVDDENNLLGIALWHFDLDPSREDVKKKSEDSKPDILFRPLPNMELCEAFFGRIGRMIKEHMGGKAHARLSILSISPKFQRMGLGERLVRDGLEQADRLHIPVWLASTPAGYGLYSKLGFKEGEVLEYDLSLYGGEGVVKHVEMIRPAV